MTDVDYSNFIDMNDELDTYLGVAFAVSGGFSKGTANVSPHDVKKLHPLLAHYAKMPHPFTACVRDNRKRFGKKTEAYCAVLKDLIVGNTDWRGKGKTYVPRALSQEEFDLEYAAYKIDIPEGFGEFLAELNDKDIQGMIKWQMPEENFAAGDVAWDESKGEMHLKSEIEAALNAGHASDGGDMGSMDMYSKMFWVCDTNENDNTALVCEGGEHYYVVPFTQDKEGDVTIGDESTWKTVEKAWVETNLSQEPQQISELFFDDEEQNKALEEDGLIWKTILREGEWAYSPGAGGVPLKRPVKIVKAGPSIRAKNLISMEEIKSNFDEEAVEHVTVPLSHQDKVHENTGYVKKMRFGKDNAGRTILEAGLQITEPEIKEKILRGSIANTSAGILWDYVKKESGKKFNTAMGHLALTNHPWLNGLASFSDLELENARIMSFSEHELDENLTTITLSNEDVNTNMNRPRGGEEVSTDTENKEVVTVVDRSFFEELNLSEDEIKSIVADYAAVKAEQRKLSIDAKGKDWQEAGKSPALVKAAKEILFADDETVSINFSEDGVTKTLSLSEVVDKLVEASPSIDLSDKLNEEDVAGAAPDADASKENERANFSDEILALAGQIWIDEGLTEEEALKEAVKRSKN